MYSIIVPTLLVVVCWLVGRLGFGPRTENWHLQEDFAVAREVSQNA